LRWFWSPNHQTVAVGFEVKLEETITTDFESKPEKTIATGFDAKPEKNIATSFEAKPEKTATLGFEDQPRSPSALVLRLNQEARTSRLSVHGVDRTQRHPTSWSPDHRVLDLCDYHRSSASDLLLLSWSSSLHVIPHLPPAHHETNKHDSPNETEIKATLPKCLKFEFKSHQVNDSSQ
jgi:hypothetical protein